MHHHAHIGLRDRLLLGAALFCLTITPGAAEAQATAIEQETADETAARETETIYVLARRRAEPLQEVPAQVRAFTARDIVDAGITTTEDVIGLAPNIALDDSFTYLNTFVVVRGISQINNADSPVAVIVDGVPQNNQRQLKMNLFDVEQIEILMGPQGALYGRNAAGGAINIVTRQPSNEFEGFASGLYGNGDAVEFSGAVSGPLVEDKLLFRVAGAYKEDGGRLENAYLGEKSDSIDHDYALRGKLLYTPAPWLTLDARVSFDDFRAGALYDSFVPSGDAGDYQEPSVSLPGVAFGNIFEAAFKADADLGGATLTAITGYTELAEEVRGDIDFSNPVNNPGGGFGAGQIGQGSDLDLSLVSQELRLVSDDEGRLRWLAGVYYVHTDRRLEAVLFADLDGTLGQIDNPALIFLRQHEDDDNDAWSVYAEAAVDLTGRLEFAAGLRYDEDNRFQRDLLSTATRALSFSAVQPEASLSYDIAADALVYLKYGEGFRSGGFNAPGAAPFEDEKVRTVETGFKSQWMDGRVTFNGAFYYSFVKDFQFFYLSLAEGGQIVSNIDRVEIYGAEFEGRARLADGWSVYGGLGTTDSEIMENADVPSSQGNHTPKMTKLSANLGTQYRFPLAGDLFGFARADYERRGERFWQIDNLDRQAPLDLLSFRAGVETGVWGLYAWGRNMTDEAWYADYNPTEYSGLGYDIGYRAQPRAYGVEARVRF